MYTRIVPMRLTVWQLAHCPSLPVTSAPKIPARSPPIALASRLRSSAGSSRISARRRIRSSIAWSSLMLGPRSRARRAEALGPDSIRRQPEPHQAIRHHLDEGSRAAGVGTSRRAERLERAGQHRLIDPSGEASPAGWLPARQRVDDLEPVARRDQPVQLVAVDDLV